MISSATTCICPGFLLNLQGGWNPAALCALVAGVLPTMPGFLATVRVIPPVHSVFSLMYDLAWFVGVAISAAMYCAMMRGVAGTADSMEAKLA